MEKSRESGIELLRIIAACMVVISHIYGHIANSASSLIGGGNFQIISLLCDCSVCAVNVFILITGYFLSRSNHRVIGKPMYLILMMIFLSSGMYVMKGFLAGFDNVKFSWTLIFPTSYFVTLYTVLYMISPYINRLIDSLKGNVLSYFILLLVLVFSVYPTFIDLIEEILNYKLPALSPISAYGSQWGYNIVNFILLYCIGAYLSRVDLRINIKWWALIYIGSIAVIVVWHIVLEQLPGYNSSAHNYHNPFVILSAIALFMVFKSLHFNSKPINYAAKAAFAVYLFHLMLLPYIHIDFHVGKPIYIFVPYLLVAIVALYGVSMLAWAIFDFVTKPLFNKLNCIEIPFSNLTENDRI